MSNDAPSVKSATSGQIITTPSSSIHSADASILEKARDSLGMEGQGEDMADSQRTSVSVAVDPVALITTECITVTSAMRKHARWAHSSVSAILGGSSAPMSPSLQGSRPATPRDDLGKGKGHKTRPSSGLTDGDDGGLANRWGLRGKKGKSMQDNPLMAGFGRLRRELTGCKGIPWSSNVLAEY
jgi:brefeldin A-resistance guanine nucleotide exchange factor 1